MLPYAVTQRTGPQQQAFRSRARRIHPNDNLSNKRHYSSIIEALQSVYKQKIKPLEQQYHFDTFHSTCLTDADVGANPRVLLLGQYGVGKSTFVKYVLRRDNPGINIGPEPTTDRFVAIMIGEERVIPETPPLRAPTFLSRPSQNSELLFSANFRFRSASLRS